MTPGEIEQARADLDRAERVLADSEAMLERSARESAANRLYYAAFHAARAAATEASAFLARCRAIVEEADARGPNEPDPPADLRATRGGS